MPYDAGAAFDAAVTGKGNVWSAPSKQIAICSCPREWTGSSCRVPVTDAVPSGSPAPRAQVHAALCGNSRLDYGTTMTSSGSVKHVESDIDCGGGALALAASEEASGCTQACGLGMSCFSDSDCALSKSGSRTCRVLPSASAVIASFGYPAPTLPEEGWPSTATGTCVRTDSVRAGRRALILRIWLWGVTKRDFAGRFLAQVLAQALGEALTRTWGNLHGSAAKLAADTTWGDMVAVMHLQDVDNGAGSRVLQAGSTDGDSLGATEVQLSISVPDEVSDLDLQAATEAALSDGGVSDRILSASPGVSLTAMSSDADSAPVVTLTGRQEGSPGAGTEQSDSGLFGGMVQGTQIALIAAAVAVVAIAAAAVVVGRRRSAARTPRGAAARRDSSIGEDITNPIARVHKSPGPSGAMAARSQRIQQLRRQFEPEPVRA